MMTKLKQNQRGFTVLESLVAILILSLSISGAFSAVVQGLHQSTAAKNEIAAFYLAQEGLEIVRNKRDSNQILRLKDLPVSSWLEGITDGDKCPFNSVCRVSAVPTNTFNICGSDWNSCDPLNQDNSGANPSYLYSYNSSYPQSPFTREIKITSITDDEISVTVRIKWQEGVFPRMLEVNDHLFNWKWDNET